jgi:acetyltransferase-like isoleucine patch superfamily enzyme
MAWLTDEQLAEMGFAYFGENVLLSNKASYYNCQNIRLGHHVRIDDFCVLSAGDGGIILGNHIHIAVYTSLIGRGAITIGNYANVSSRVSVYSSSDDYSGAAMTNPMVPENLTNVRHADVEIGRHVIIGSGSIVLPGVNLHEGAAIGALSLVKDDCEAFGIYAGIPAKLISSRKRDLLSLEQELIAGSRNS